MGIAQREISAIDKGHNSLIRVLNRMTNQITELTVEVARLRKEHDEEFKHMTDRIDSIMHAMVEGQS